MGTHITDDAERASADPASWFRAEQRAAVQDFWQVYEDDKAAIQASALDWLRQHVELRLAKCLSDSQLREEHHLSQTILARAASGDIGFYSRQLEGAGRRYSELGVHFSQACDLATGFRRQLLPRLVERHSGEPKRLTAAIQALDDFVEHGAAVVAQGYIKHLEAQSQAREILQMSRLRASELEGENHRIEEANRLRSEFLTNMSHELRTPLNSVIGFAELLYDEQVGEVSARQREFLGEILAGGRHLLRLINEVLDLAKVEAGKLELHPEPADLRQLVAAVVQAFKASAIERGIAIDVFIDPALTAIVLDHGRFKQVLYNYLSNALKFTPSRGRVSVRLMPEGDTSFRLEVEDNGIGVSSDDTQRLFTAFQQLDSGAAQRHGGTGLGLALTKRLAEAQGGSVGMRAAPQQGSIFFAILSRT